MINVKTITTEGINKETVDIDELKTIDIVKKINEQDKLVPYAIEQSIAQIAAVVDKATEVYKSGGRIIYIGSGTSGRLGVLDASEIKPTYGIENGIFVGVMSGGEKALTLSIEDVEDSKDLPVIDLKKIKLNKKDMVIGITSSGRTPYPIHGVKYAKELGCSTASIATSKNSEINNYVDLPIEVITGPEVISGSTRMKSGSAEKMILNIISSSVMIKSGKTYGNLMTNLDPSNEKLKARAKEIVTLITNKDEDIIDKNLKTFNHNIRATVFKTMLDITDKQAIEFSNSDRSIREILNSEK
ncbi:MAG: N-acetylmuramic acid 6-phosphate etherase [Mycoplasmataceae bacterium]|nr:N-acetylmuramic acid 6-phosphate etherase [Mycoplasmataceae bacterium]